MFLEICLCYLTPPYLMAPALLGYVFVRLYGRKSIRIFVSNSLRDDHHKGSMLISRFTYGPPLPIKCHVFSLALHQELRRVSFPPKICAAKPSPCGIIFVGKARRRLGFKPFSYTKMSLMKFWIKLFFYNVSF